MGDNELYHYGIRGMRWGTRRGGAKSSVASKMFSKVKKAPPEEVHEDYTKTHSKKSVKAMSDQELRERINRLNMENQYKQLNRVQTKLGKNVVTGILGNAAKQTTTNYVSKFMTKSLEELLKKPV